MQLAGKAKKVTIFVGQPHGERGGHNYLRVLERLKAEGAAGATAFKAIAAFGARAHVQTVRLVDVTPDLPVMIVWIDTPERVERILPHLQEMVTEGLILIEDTEAVLYATTAVPDLPTAASVGEVMTREVASVHPDTPMSEVVAYLVEQRFRAVPVIDVGRKVVGIVTAGDLVRRGGLPARMELLRTFDTPNIHAELQQLGEQRREAREVMTSPVVTAHPELDVRHAAELMCRRKLKRLPVVDTDGRLVGMVSGVDLLRTIASTSAALQPEDRHPVHAERHQEGTHPIRTIMSPEVPTVRADAPLPEVLNAVSSNRLNRAVVVDEASHVLGIVTDSELIERLAPGAHPGALRVLMHRLPFVRGSPEWEEATRHARGNRARDLMITDIVVAHEDEPIRDVLAAMLQKGRKIVPIVNGAEELAGIVDRADLLQVLVDG